MKVKIASGAILFLVILAVILNTGALKRTIDGFCETVEALEINEGDIEGSLLRARRIYSDFKRAETYMSLTVNHNDLTAIEEIFSEMIGCLSVGDSDGARIAKSRLSDALMHLRRLSGVNIDSVI